MDDTTHPTENPRAESSATGRMVDGLTIELLTELVRHQARAADALEQLASIVTGGVRSTMRRQSRRLTPEDKEALAIAELLRRAPYIPSIEEIAEEIGISRSAAYGMAGLKQRRKEAIAAQASTRTLKGIVRRRRSGETEFDAWEEEDLE
jgi:hypothetical protein